MSDTASMVGNTERSADPFCHPLCCEEARVFADALKAYGLERAADNILRAVAYYANGSWLHIEVGEVFFDGQCSDGDYSTFASMFTPKEWRAIYYCVAMFYRWNQYNRRCSLKKWDKQLAQEYKKLMRLIEDHFEKYTPRYEWWFSEKDGGRWIEEINQDHEEDMIPAF